MNESEGKVEKQYFSLHCAQKSKVRNEEGDGHDHEKENSKDVMESRHALVKAAFSLVFAAVRDERYVNNYDRL